MTALSDRLEYPTIRPVALLEVVAGKWLKFWTLTSGQTYTYEATTSLRVLTVYENGHELISRGSIASIEANAGSYYWDQAAGKIYVHPTGSVSPYAKTIQARIRFLFGTESRVIDGKYYDGRIVSLPDLSARIEATFGDPGQVGAGKVDLAAGDGYFDDIGDLQWDAGEALLKLGIDEVARALPLGQGADGVVSEEGETVYGDPGGGVEAQVPGITEAVRVYRQCDYADFETVAGVRVVGWSQNSSVFSLELEEKKGILKKKIPITSWSRDSYPNMEEDKVGEVIPVVYGTVYDVRPTCIDTTTRTFRVAVHAINEFIAVRVKKKASETAETDTWVNVSFAWNHEPDAQFSLSADDWDGEADVAVDFSGRLNPDGSLMVNPSDVVKDLLTTWMSEPESSLDLDSFSESHSYYHLGVDSDGNPTTHLSLSLYLAEAENASDIIGNICSTVGASFHHDLNGKYRFVAWNPLPGESCLSFTSSEVQRFEEITDATAICSYVKAGYQYRAEQDYAQVYAYERAEAQYLQGANTPIVEDLEELPLSEVEDARYVVQRTARMKGERLRKFKVRLCHRAWRLRPGEFIHVAFEEKGIDSVFEVLEVRRRLAGALWVDVVLGDLRGMKDTPGFWMADAATFPSRLGGGSCAAWSSAWTDEQKAWARQNCGYWLDDNGFADSADPDSFMSGAWI